MLDFLSTTLDLLSLFTGGRGGIDHNIVTSHGGFIDIESAVGQGTRFNIYIPTLGERRLEPRVTTVQPSRQGKATKEFCWLMMKKRLL